jgi:hypothetical protein
MRRMTGKPYWHVQTAMGKRFEVCYINTVWLRMRRGYRPSQDGRLDFGAGCSNTANLIHDIPMPTNQFVE